MERKIQIIIGSPVEYKELVAYIVIDSQHIALLNQDEGKGNIKIEFFPDTELGIIDFDLFINTLQNARNELLK